MGEKVCTLLKTLDLTNDLLEVKARRPLLFSELLCNNNFNAAFPLDSFALVGLCCHRAINADASGVLKRAIGRRAVTHDANEYVAVGIAGTKERISGKYWPTAGEFGSVPLYRRRVSGKEYYFQGSGDSIDESSRATLKTEFAKSTNDDSIHPV